GGSPRLRFATAEGVMLAELTVYANEAPRLALGRVGSREFFSVSLLPDGSSRLELADEQGRPRALLDTGAGGMPGLWLVDAKGQLRASLKVSAEDEPSLQLEGRSGASFSAPVPVP
ncbi:MAG: hypothetical protein ABW123_20315, partial [Cystobacter sp.]